MDQLSYRARAQQQREHRHSANIDAFLLWDGFNQPVTIRNISIYGALLIGGWFPPVGQRVTLIAEGLEVTGTVIWEGPDRCGLLLSHAVDPVAVIEQSGHPADTHATITLQRIGPDRYA